MSLRPQNEDRQRLPDSSYAAEEIARSSFIKSAPTPAYPRLPPPTPSPPDHRPGSRRLAAGGHCVSPTEQHYDIKGFGRWKANFYKSLGMKVVRAKDYGDFSNYFLASSANVDPSVDYSSLDDAEAKAKLSMLFGPVLELTHNHGTEKDVKHFNGNEEGRQGFGHIGFLVDDVYAACDDIRKLGYGFRKEPDGGSMKGLAFAFDPDGYSVEIIKRGGIDFGDVKVEE